MKKFRETRNSQTESSNIARGYYFFMQDCYSPGELQNLPHMETRLQRDGYD